MTPAREAFADVQIIAKLNFTLLYLQYTMMQRRDFGFGQSFVHFYCKSSRATHYITVASVTNVIQLAP